jgi:uncharacterized membrane protein YoaK (UPF0700 family)
MSTFFADARGTLLPELDSRQGPLPTLLVITTVVTGIVDSFSYLKLGHVFVANSTGNILFLGFALAHTPGFSIYESLLALAAIVVGAAIGGKISSAFADHRGKILSASTSAQALFFAAALVFSTLYSTPVQSVYRSSFVAVLGLAMGIQNAAARKIAVPDLTTTVLTLTIAGLGADSTLVGGTGSRAGRRFVAIGAMLIGAMLIGAVAGATLEIHTALYYPLIAALAAVVAVASWSALAGRSNAQWTKAQ